MRWLAVLLLVCSCDRLFDLEHISASGDAAGTTSDVDIGSTACAGSPVFCDDFDRDDGVSDGWDRANVLGMTTATLSSAASVSPPGSLLLRVPAGDTGSLAKDLTSAANVEVTADISVERFDASAEVDLVELRWNVVPIGCSRVSFILVTRGNPRQLTLQEIYESCGALVYTDIAQLAPGFQRVAIFVKTGTPSRVRVKVDGMQRLDKELPIALPSAPQTLAVGVLYINGQTAPWEVRFDNVRADTL